MVWKLSGYGELPLQAEATEIVFAGVDYFEITPRDPEIPDFAEDTRLEGLTRIPPEDDTSYMLTNGVPWLDPDEERFHLWFAFRGGQHIRVGAETATLTVKYINDAP